MDFILAVSIFAFALIISLIKGISIIIPLITGLFLFASCALYRGNTPSSVLKMMRKGIKKALTVLRIFVLIGILTAIWRSSGTISFFVYYGIKIIHPEYFILLAFWLSCIVSFALGTSFGTVGTIGIVLIVLARGSQVDINMVAGAIISGAYFGDRCAPTSSSANLVAALTETSLYDNVKNMLITGTIPFILSSLIYLYLSKLYPMTATDNVLSVEIAKYYKLSIIAAVPALVIFAASAFKLDVKLSMCISILSGIIISVALQGLTLKYVLHSMIFGYELNAVSPFSEIVSGGGLLSMLKVSIMIIIASTYSGIFDETGMLNDVEKSLKKLSLKISLYPTMIITSIITVAFCCNQTLAVMLTNQLMGKLYEDKGYSTSLLALDLENTVIMIAVLIPWSIAIAVPIATLSVNAGAVPYTVFPFLVPLVNMFRIPIKPESFAVHKNL